MDQFLRFRDSWKWLKDVKINAPLTSWKNRMSLKTVSNFLKIKIFIHNLRVRRIFLKKHLSTHLQFISELIVSIDREKISISFANPQFVKLIPRIWFHDQIQTMRHLSRVYARLCGRAIQPSKGLRNFIHPRIHPSLSEQWSSMREWYSGEQWSIGPCGEYTALCLNYHR